MKQKHVKTLWTVLSLMVAIMMVAGMFMRYM